MNEQIANIINRLDPSAKSAEDTLQLKPGVPAPTLEPTYEPTLINAEELHEEDAYAAVFLNVILIVCVLLAYVIKENRIYFLPER